MQRPLSDIYNRIAGNIGLEGHNSIAAGGSRDIWTSSYCSSYFR